MTDISGATGMAILHALVDGKTNPEYLSTLAKGRLTEKVRELQRALKGSIGTHQMQMLKLQLDHIEFLSTSISEMDEDIKKTESADEYMELLDEIPGIGRRSAERIIAETGIEMTQFRNADHFYDFGSDYFNTIFAEKIKQRNIKSLEKLGYSVSLS